MQPTLRDTIDACQTGDPDVTVAAVFDRLACPAKWRELFYGVVRDECRRLARYAVLDNIAAATGGQWHPDDHSSTASGRGSFLAERMYCGPEHGHVVIGEATVEQIQCRIAAQLRLRSGIDADIERLRLWVAEIVAAGATCLNDVYAQAAA